MKTGHDPISPEDLLSYWFSDAAKAKWFKPNSEFDGELKARFEPSFKTARSGALASWAQDARSMLALIILLDQIPRNIYRDKPEAFAADGQALASARQAVERGLEARLSAEGRQFLYMPFMHSEALEDQDQGVALFAGLGLEEPFRFMQRHRDIIARFGRFPHRNAALGRQSTEEEIAFLERPGSRF
jgi:uncharacterized protein (DUF924 family)